MLIFILLLFAPFSYNADAQSTAQVVSAQKPLPEYLRHPYRFWHINTENGGLSQNTVFAALQDRKGFLWIATGDGLNRFDGHSCKVFRHNPGDSTSLSARIVYSLLEDSEGHLWCSTERGVVRFVPQTGRFEQYNRPIKTPYSAPQFARSMFEDEKKRVWACLGVGLFYVDKQKKRLLPASKLDSSGRIFENQHTFSIPNWFNLPIVTFLDSKDSLYKCFLWNAQQNRFAPYRTQPDNVPIKLYPSYIDKQGTVWLYQLDVKTKTSPTLWTYNPVSGTLKRSYVFPGDLLGCVVLEDDFGQYWFAQPHSIEVFNPQTQKSDTIRYNPNDAEGLSSDILHVNLGHRYKYGKHYISSDGGGVNLFKPAPKFSHIRRTSETAPNQLSANMLWGMAEDSAGYVWMATIGGGINRFNPSTGELRSFLGKESNRPVLCTRDGSVWTANSSLHCIQSLSLSPHISTFALPQEVSFGETVFSLIQDRSGLIWCGLVGNRTICFNPTTQKFTRIHSGLGAYLYTDSKGRIWAGGNGITVFDPADVDRIRFSGKDSTPNLFTRLLNDPTNPTSLVDNDVRGFHEDTDGTMWIATIRGLDHFDPATKRFTHYNENNGMPNSYVYGILPDDNGNLWISTNRGLSKFNKAAKTWRNYSPYDGLQSYEFDRSSFVRLRKGGTDGRLKGWMLFGGVNGFNIFHPDSVRDNPDKPPVAITNILIHDKPYSEYWQNFPNNTPQFGTSEVSELTALDLAYDQNTLGFEFAALEFTDPSRNRYAYKMEGVDKNWVESGTLRTARYAGLAPGEYVFRVKACNNDGVWNEEGTSLRIRITPPFWRTWWFYGLSVFAILGSSVGGTRLVLRRRLEQRLTEERFAQQIERERLEKALEVERERRRISQDIHDEVGSGLTKILMLSQNASEAGKQSSEISLAAQGVIDGMQEIIWSINPKNDTLQSLIAFIRSYGREFVSAAGINVTIETPEDLAIVPLRTDVRRNVFLAVKEALNNAVKYAEATEICIRLEIEAERYIFTIGDNGKGFAYDGESLPTVRGGNGLANMRMRMEEIGGGFKIESSIGEGTRVVMIVPKGNEQPQ